MILLNKRDAKIKERFDNMLNKSKKKNQVYEVLLTPIVYEKKNEKIFRDENKILSGQKYVSIPDRDMSDFAIGFYEIIYKDILNGNTILNKDGKLHNEEFAGDTMNSFNTIANKTPGAGLSRKQRTDEVHWPPYLVDYKDLYPCLANFWILPKEIGRTIRGELNKAKSPIKDYVDRFLKMVNDNVKFDGSDREYFHQFDNWEDFVRKHFVHEVFVTKELNVIEFSGDDKKNIDMEFINVVSENIKKRAKCIADSKYADELWEYFNKLNVL